MDINIDTKLCNYYLTKNGKIIYLPLNNYKKFLCLMKKIKLINLMQFPYLYGKDENEILSKLEILIKMKNNNFKFLKYNLKDDIYKKNTLLFFFNDKTKNAEDIVLNLLFFEYLRINNKLLNYFESDNQILNKLLIEFIILKKIYKKISNNKILIQIFYQHYIYSNEIKNFLIDNKLTLKNFKSYNDLYLFLKKNNFINIFYNIYAKYIIKNYKKIYNNIVLTNKCKIYKKKMKKYIENYDDINLFKIIDKYINNKFNKKIIKNKFIELLKKYNIK